MQSYASYMKPILMLMVLSANDTASEALFSLNHWPVEDSGSVNRWTFYGKHAPPRDKQTDRNASLTHQTGIGEFAGHQGGL